ncbi:Por secretion system C-terminal sorting domain-containing protein [Soonwooa buanensis]|uniref:Por secretion system C-terminal sorting domain-containing protein n=1 Tax=Soonwooa buanensis TaxID=619805 RepID=A0A1T5D3C2_9FLAO|nr:ELWxxDGT repeat protein [Soonwooa buanensis]SKB66117.1 Por secretion system C-terminal sorting domain-containing protein [Soonwooa buanensis]
MKKIYLSIFMLTVGMYQSQSLVLVKDIRPGSSSGNAANFITYNNKLYFSATDGVSGTELWESDGTEAGTKMVQDFNAGSGNFNPNSFVEKQGELFFAGGIGSMPSGVELYKYSPSNGISLFADIKEGSASSSPNQLQLSPDKSTIYFRANDVASTSARVYKTNGVTAPTAISSNFISSSPLLVIDDVIFAAGGTDTSNIELYKSEGGEFSLIKDIRVSGSSSPSNFYYSPTFNKMFFTARSDENGTEPWMTDGTPQGTILLKDINKSGQDQATTNAGISQFIDYNGKLYFAANNGVTGSELWVSDGTADGTQILKDIIPGTTGSNPSTFVEHQGLLYFVANDATAGRELFVTDGTSENTRMVLDINPGVNGSSISDIISFNDKLYVVATADTTIGKELYEVKDPTLSTGTVLVSKIKVFPNPSNGDFRISANNYQTYKIYDFAGKLVKSGIVDKQEIKSGVKTGQYILVLEGDNTKESTTIIIK